jgi:hypothetical protein
MKGLFTAAALSLALASPAAATIVMVDASSIQGENVLFNAGVQQDTQVFRSYEPVADVSSVYRDDDSAVERDPSRWWTGEHHGSADGRARKPERHVQPHYFHHLATPGLTFNDLEFNLPQFFRLDHLQGDRQ